ncbi:hypothetical protein LOTGIDRAFT_163170 [Lottia gigantea]|uniref:Uncharacterized protein n=1 Tax=Lottia gigantea TaxID=225164 RepID=V4A9R0_LOTGI|nr:hypothetical protein LOTGIDRAFT_163170 [Lottia gigantea]ESO91810.1 hypothetical protein LOTGIDRAFT_163170 [Lottia gigantea]
MRNICVNGKGMWRTTIHIWNLQKVRVGLWILALLEVIHCAELEKHVENWRKSMEQKSKNAAPSLFGSVSVKSSVSSTRSSLKKEKEKFALAELNIQKIRRQQDISKRIQELEMEREMIMAESKLEEARVAVETLVVENDEKDINIDKSVAPPHQFEFYSPEALPKLSYSKGKSNPDLPRVFQKYFLFDRNKSYCA